MFKKTCYLLTLLTLTGAFHVFAFQPAQMSMYFNGPTVSSVSTSTALVALSPTVLSGITVEEKSGIYFEYGESKQVCIMIYPTPESCLPKKTVVGKTSAMLTNLKPNTSYTVTYKRDNTIRCITAPCPGNEFQSLSVEFTTKAVELDGTEINPTNVVRVSKDLFLGSRGEQVVALQTILINKGYMTGSPTGYFGFVTLKAVKRLQGDHGISKTGYVGKLTRAVLTKMIPIYATVTSIPKVEDETFEGTVTAYSTQCFSDGECSITVDGKKVVTTLGRSQVIVGSMRGIPDFGAIENNLGAHAKVYAKKIDGGYTLYGDGAYYIEISPKGK